LSSSLVIPTTRKPTESFAEVSISQVPFRRVVATTYDSFYEDKYFLDSSAFVYFTLFESNFVSITPDNYSQVETANSKVLLFMIVSSTVLIEHKIFNSEKVTTKVCQV